jgi:hypothetical protein
MLYIIYYTNHYKYIIKKFFCFFLLFFFFKENEEESENMYISDISPNPNSRNGSPAQSFLEMLSSGPSRSPSPARPPTVDHEDINNPSLTNWGFQYLEGDVSL